MCRLCFMAALDGCDLIANERLKALDVDGRRGEALREGWRGLETRAAGRGVSRESLVQHNNSLGAEGAGALAPALAKMTGLQSLSLVRWLWV